MTKLGERDMKDVPIDQMVSGSMEDLSSASESENNKKTLQSTRTSKDQGTPRTEPVPIPTKKKRVMSEKQLEILWRDVLRSLK